MQFIAEDIGDFPDFFDLSKDQAAGYDEKIIIIKKKLLHYRLLLKASELNKGGLEKFEISFKIEARERILPQAYT
ncbi:hypothetical protein DPPLL_30460 [Desulfofustis limnaeus]|uniref:Uncharacterized protein n=1 Tax=Desulfofustis limnaeus TaxID=2740163 RepID=A0ABN6M742_9BACT|nr:hypothetical protein DPPLL_30460 [Desulfofustis limnaeus]